MTRPLRTLAPRALAGALLLAALPAGCGDGPARRPNVVLIVVDTLRADRVGCYGAERDTTPRIDALAREGVRFERAYSSSSWTLPAVATILTGLYPAGHNAIDPKSALPEEVETLAERLSKAGYRTAGVNSNGLVGRKYGFAQGFDVYDDTHARGHAYVSTPGVGERASELLEDLAAEGAPFFLYLLFFDPHYQYLRHPEFDFASDGAGRLTGEEDIKKLRRLAPSFSPQELRFVRDVYDEEVRFTDRGIGRVLDKLVELGLDGDTIVVFAADHGEDFLDHGWLGHVRHFYEEYVRVPLIVRAPGGERGAVIEKPVGITSILPTVLELAGLEGDPQAYHGPSLAPLVRGERTELEPQLLFAVDFTPVSQSNADKEAHKSGLLAGWHKLVRDDVSGALELYDLRADPAERANLALELPELAAGLAQRLDAALETAAMGGAAAAQVTHTAEELQQLDDLGYGGE